MFGKPVIVAQQNNSRHVLKYQTKKGKRTPSWSPQQEQHCWPVLPQCLRPDDLLVNSSQPDL